MSFAPVNNPVGRMYQLSKEGLIKLRNDSTSIRVGRQIFYQVENFMQKPFANLWNFLLTIIATNLL